mmetsp:Transcript_89279/g.158368  ORF Transcript_89279/g.158368 Transcript_89279/m.158368 type:complete len:382 (-) Transcript_89279:53-1198(-)
MVSNVGRIFEAWQPSPLIRQWREHTQDVAVCSLGSPQGIRIMQKLEITESLMAIVLLPAHIVIFMTVSEPEVRPGFEIWPICIVPVLISLLRFRLLFSERRQCQALLDSLRMNGETAQVIQLLRHFTAPGAAKLVAISSILLPMYFVGITWCLIGSTCGTYADMMFWELEVEAIPCEAYSLTISFLFCLLSLTMTCRLVASSTLRARLARGVRVSQPALQNGLTDDHLRYLPSFTFGSEMEHADRSAETFGEAPGEELSCSICLEPLSVGQRVRKLPCIHLFHVECVDSWLKRTAKCPLRCPTDLKRELEAIRLQSVRSGDAEVRASSEDAEARPGSDDAEARPSPSSQDAEEDISEQASPPAAQPSVVAATTIGRDNQDV